MNEQKMNKKMMDEMAYNLGYWKEQVKLLEIMQRNLQNAIVHAETQCVLYQKKCEIVMKKIRGF